MTKIFITADQHFFHGNIIKYCNRPFKSLEQMNETIIRNHNERVKPNDIVYHIGDFCFRNSNNSRGEGTRTTAEEYIQKLNGRIVFIKGNHDQNNSLKTVIESMVINYGGKRMWLIHDPKYARADYSINLVGHIHNNWKFQRREDSIIINVGVDVWGFKPMKLQEIIRFYHLIKKGKVNEA